MLGWDMMIGAQPSLPWPRHPRIPEPQRPRPLGVEEAVVEGVLGGQEGDDAARIQARAGESGLGATSLEEVEEEVRRVRRERGRGS